MQSNNQRDRIKGNERRKEEGRERMDLVTLTSFLSLKQCLIKARTIFRGRTISW